MTDKPKSIRLNSTHRDNIIELLMKQWEIKNPPPPTMYNKLQLLREIFNKYRRATGATPPEHRVISRMYNLAAETVSMLKELSPLLAAHVQISKDEDLCISVQNDDGKQFTSFYASMPIQLAEELEFPIAKSCRKNITGSYGISVPPEYLLVAEPLIYIAVAFTGEGTKSIAIPRSSKEWKAYEAREAINNTWNGKRSDMHREIQVYLSQFTTTAQVREFWPELEQFLPADIADPSRGINFPALTKTSLNQRLGL